MWLRDVNVDVRLGLVLLAKGVSADNTIARGWRELTNGNLVAASVDAGFYMPFNARRYTPELVARKLVKCLATFILRTRVGASSQQVSQYILPDYKNQSNELIQTLNLLQLGKVIKPTSRMKTLELFTGTFAPEL